MSQQSLADKVGLSRPAVANHITQLVEKGYIVGKAYVLNEQQEDLIVCVGAANVDYKLIAHQDIIYETSNPITKTKSMGGVIRNIAENCGRLDLNVSLLTLMGEDNLSDVLLNQLKGIVQTLKITKRSDQNTGSYYAVLNPDGGLVCGLADMEICELMNRDWISSYEMYLKSARMVIVDTNVQADCIDYLVELSQSSSFDLVIVGVSSIKTNRLPKKSLKIFCGVFNFDESQAYFKSDEDAETLAKRWVKHGVKHSIVTSGTDPLYYASESESFSLPIKSNPNVVDVTGAGDSFLGGLIYGIIKKHDMKTAITYGLVNSYHTVESNDSVREELSTKLIEKEMENY